MELGQWIAVAIVAVKKHDWIDADERKAPRFFVAFGGFKKKTRLTIVDLGKRTHWRLYISHQIDNQRDQIAAFREFAELGARGSDIQIHNRCRLAKALPEPDFKYRSNRIARYLSENSKYESSNQGANFDVCCEVPELWFRSLRFRSDLEPMYFRSRFD